MNYTVTNIPLKKLHTYNTSGRKCELHKFTDGTEFMMYTIMGHKHTTQFVFDSDDFDIIDSNLWKRYGDNILCRRSFVSTFIRNKYSSNNVYVAFKSVKNKDYRKI
ncbi:MAG: hypothetical protein Faunusvirus8_29 [Faunusvirus sp.]|jgi:hypothetical protein|uniref:Uncharacterized protein n=1 Tax=Faunusvirus sp. TaxID=2487766 RepID=A0A3G4ZWL9_9VIRU|nr:MAG: hypothetical protein Faunusvirus8_29 [Faunusvirus sp.]